MTKRLTGLIAEISACRICRDAPQFGERLPHEPRPVLRAKASARICVAGQAPGTRVHASGLPFNDPSGDRLRDWMGVTRDEFYDASKIAVVPMGFCFPGLDAKGGDLPPRRECAPHWREAVFARLPKLELVLTIGQYAHAWHLGADRKKTLTETVRAWRDYYDADADRRVLPLPHPSWRNTAWLKKNPWFEKEVLPVLRREVSGLIGK
jgi:uracil-DNA glycosylase